MSRVFLAMLAVGGVLVGAILLTVVSSNQSHLLTLEGGITDVRIEPLSDGANLVLLDLTATNPSKVPFEIKRAEVVIGPDEKTVAGGVLSKRELASFADFKKLTDQNPPIGPGDIVKPGEKVSRMIAVRFEPDVKDLGGANFRIRFHDINEVLADIGAMSASKR